MVANIKYKFRHPLSTNSNINKYKIIQLGFLNLQREISTHFFTDTVLFTTILESMGFHFSGMRIYFEVKPRN